MNPRVEVRRAAESDAEGIAHVHVQAWHEAYSHLLSEETLASLREGPRADQWRGTLRAGRTDVWVAVDGEVMPGVRHVEFTVRPGALTYYSPLG